MQPADPVQQPQDTTKDSTGGSGGGVGGSSVSESVDKGGDGGIGAGAIVAMSLGGAALVLVAAFFGRRKAADAEDTATGIDSSAAPTGDEAT
jgi:hypothetical protein